MKKRWLAMLVAGCMLIGSVGMTALANEEKDGAGVENVVSDTPKTQDENSSFTVSGNVLTKYTGSGGNVTIPDTVEIIGARVFEGNDKITSVIIPGNVKSIGMRAFRMCTSLTNVTIPESVTEINREAFFNCSLTSVTIPGTVKNIGEEAFGWCTSMASLTISNGVKSIGHNAFDGCKSLNNITIPSSVTNIEGYAFWNCGSNTGGKLTDINYPGTKKQWEAISIDGEVFPSVGVTIHCTDGDIKIPDSQTTPETPRPEESKPAPEEPKKDSSSSSSHNSGGSSQNNKPASAPAPSEPKTEQEVVRETIENLPQGGQAVLETSSVIGSSNLRKIMEKGGGMVVFSPQVSWHFDTLTNGDMDFNPGIEVGADIPDLQQKLSGQPAVSATVIRFAHNGILPGAAYVGIAVNYAPGTRLYFYYYNRSTGLFEFQQSVTVEDGGYVVVNLTHCSDYILTTEPLSAGVANGPVPAAGAGSGAGAANGAAKGNLDSTPHTGI